MLSQGKTYTRKQKKFIVHLKQFYEKQLKIKWLLVQSHVEQTIGLVALLVLFIWFCCRIEPEPGKLAILIHKTGPRPNTRVISRHFDPLADRRSGGGRWKHHR
jgi:hypothetical protein